MTKHDNTGHSCTSCLGNLRQTTTAREDELCYHAMFFHMLIAQYQANVYQATL